MIVFLVGDILQFMSYKRDLARNRHSLTLINIYNFKTQSGAAMMPCMYVRIRGGP
jgi:hypothetical protein